MTTHSAVPTTTPAKPRRIAVTTAPLAVADDNVWVRGRWPAAWVGPAMLHDGKEVVLVFRLRFRLEKTLQARLHLSADQRYLASLDGEPFARGPERGDLSTWAFESFDVDLAPGEHLLTAKVWWLGTGDLHRPFAQFSSRPGFLLFAEGAPAGLLDTGTAAWEWRALPGHASVQPRMVWGTGAKLHLRGPDCDWAAERGGGDGWQAAVGIERATMAEGFCDGHLNWMLIPAQLPAMAETVIQVGKARHVDRIDSFDTGKLAADPAQHQAATAATWDALLAGAGTVTVPAHSRIRVLIDLGDYHTAYPELIARGAGTRVRIWWAESLFETPGDSGTKGRRDTWAGKFFAGIGDTFDLTRDDHLYTTLWWEAGRWLEVLVETTDAPADISALRLRQTGYPFTWRGEFSASDARLAEVVPVALRTLASCAHETYVDCPYYEQLMYVGDTRLEVLTTYVYSGDDRLPRKALQLFDASRTTSGLTRSRYPSWGPQIIPPFSLWWIGMVRDFAWWRDDAALVKSLLPGVRAVIDAHAAHIGKDGRFTALMGWNFVDWVADWVHGMPKDANRGCSGVVAWQTALACVDAAAIEDAAGDPECSARCRRLARTLADGCEAFWDEARGLYADDLAHSVYSEHAQILALLSGQLNPARAERVAAGLIAASSGGGMNQDLARTTIYFSHYLFELFGRLGRADLIITRMGPWFDQQAFGLKTLLERPEPSRSDCHAWGAHPLFHYLATILGIRPANPGFSRVLITPQLGTLAWARGSMPHGAGAISVDLVQTNGRISGEITLPPGLSGEVVIAGRRQALTPGRQRVGGP